MLKFGVTDYSINLCVADGGCVHARTKSNRIYTCRFDAPFNATI
jgi:hypothetical protein